MTEDEVIRIAKAEFDKYGFSKYELLGTPTKRGGDHDKWLKMMEDLLKKHKADRKLRRHVIFNEKLYLDEHDTTKWSVGILIEDKRYKDGLNTMSVWIDDSTGKIIEVSSLRDQIDGV